MAARRLPAHRRWWSSSISGTFDVLVIGGGITGVGVALDAATRGLRVALVERDDFASGTSSKSSKLVHGGLRYLQQGEVRLVYEALHERQRLRRNAPHLVRVLPFMIPVLTKDSVVSRKIARALGSAMWMYDLTGGWRIGRFHRRLKADAAFAHLPTMPRERLRVGVPVLRRHRRRRPAVPHGRPHRRGARRRGRQPLPGHGDHQGRRRPGRRGGRRRRRRAVTVRAKVVVNAAGVWADDVRALDEGSHPRLDPPGQGRAHHRAVGQGAQRHRRRHPGAEGQAQPVRRPVGRSGPTARSSTPTSAPPTPTTTARSTTRSAPPTTSPTCCGRSTPRSPPASRATTSPAPGPGLRPLVKADTVAPATASRHARRPVAPPQRAPRRRPG